ncbi:hypothetical protein NUM3379_16300 [Kineococcus sp. NUM-3379]
MSDKGSGNRSAARRPSARRALALLPAALATAGLLATAPAASAAVTDAVLQQQDHDRLQNGKHSATFVTYDRGQNQVTGFSTVGTPFWFHGARNDYTITLWANGQAVWSHTSGLTACALTDPSCGSTVTGFFNVPVSPDLAATVSTITVENHLR